MKTKTEPKAKKQGTGNKKIYVFATVFTLLWFFLFIVNFTRKLDYGWDHFILNLPDMMQRFTPSGNTVPLTFAYGKYINKAANPKVTITAIDELTLERYGWPVKRRYYGELVDKLAKLGVKAVGVDVILFEPDKDNPENDRRYVDAVARAGNMVNLVHVDPDTRKVKQPLKGLTRHSLLIGQPHVEVTMDSDGQIRRYSPFYPGEDTDVDGVDDKFLTYKAAGLRDVKCWDECADMPIVSLGAGAYAAYTGKTISHVFMEISGEKILNYRYVKNWKLHPAWDKDEKNVRPAGFRHISMADILSGQLTAEEKEALKGGVTFLGSTALGAFDHMPSPFLSQLPGVEVHATFLDNLLAGDFRVEFGLLYSTLLLLLLPWLPVFMRRYSLAAMISVCLGVIAGLVVMDISLLANNILMPFASILMSLLVPFAYITVDKGLMEGREKKWIKSTFGQYLSPKVVELITKDPSRLSLGGEKRDMTAFFLDIAGFTTMSEKMTPEELTSMLNEYLSALTDIILKHDGVVDKYIGDCIMAFWNAPLDQKDHRKLACLAAVDCQAEMARLNEKLTQYAIKPSCRVGLNSGPMVVGNMGSKTRLSYTVMGDSVNLASRLEGANKFFHSQIMASGETFEGAKDLFDYRFLGSIRVVGKAIPVKVYEPFARKGAAGPEITAMLKSYEAGTEKFYAGKYAQAAKDFKAALKARPADGPSQFYLELAEKYEKEAPKDWDGSFNLTSK